MASQLQYNDHPLPAPPPHQQQYGNYQPDPAAYSSSYNNNNQPSLPQSSPEVQQYQPRQPQTHFAQQQSPPHRTPAQAQKSERNRPRSRGFSFRSDKSQKTDKSGQGVAAHRISSADIYESPEDNESKKFHSKANPTLAMQEAEPSAIARSKVDFDEKPPLSSFQHKDLRGVPISEPDRSNPTRSKWERPLDTIRSFEAAVDDGHHRNSVIRADSDSVVGWNRRNSYYGSKPRHHSHRSAFPAHHKKSDNNGPRFPHDSYYGGRPLSTIRPESAMYDPRGSAMMSGSGPGPRDGYLENYDAGPSGGPGRANRYPRAQNSEPYLNTHPAVNRSVYPSPNHRSYETVGSSGQSGSLGEPSGYQTDPTSSENSSIDRRSPMKRQEPTNDYGINFGQSATYQPSNLGSSASQPRTMPDNPYKPAPPPKSTGVLMRKASQPVSAAGTQRPDMGEKRKSWFARRFSKNS